MGVEQRSAVQMLQLWVYKPMSKESFCKHMEGFLATLGDNYLAANLEDALQRYREGRSRRPPVGRAADESREGGFGGEL